MRLIDADALLKSWKSLWGGDEEYAETIRYKIAEAPTVDAVEVRWKDGTPPDMTGQDRVWIIAEIPSLFNPNAYGYDTFVWLDGGGWNERAVSRATRWTYMPMPGAKMEKAVEE